MSTRSVTYQGGPVGSFDVTGPRGVTPRAFGGQTVLEYVQDPSVGVFFDLGLSGYPELTTSGSAGGITLASDAGGATSVVYTDSNEPAIRITCDTTDNDGALIRVPAAPVRIGAAATGDIGFAARFAVPTATSYNAFVGLVDTDEDQDLIGNTGTLAAASNYVGFQVLESAATTLRVIFGAGGQTPQVIGANVATLAAGTFVDLAIKFDKSAGELYFYVDGELVATATSTQIAADTFPNDVNLVPGAAVATATGAARSIDISALRLARAID